MIVYLCLISFCVLVLAYVGQKVYRDIVTCVPELRDLKIKLQEVQSDAVKNDQIRKNAEFIRDSYPRGVQRSLALDRAKQCERKHIHLKRKEMGYKAQIRRTRKRLFRVA